MIILPKKYSEDDSTKDKGGDLGWVNAGDTVPDFEQATLSNGMRLIVAERHAVPVVRFSLQLDATEARHMAMFEAGLWPERPRITPVMGHPWETAWVGNEPVPWEVEPHFSRLEWLP